MVAVNNADRGFYEVTIESYTNTDRGSFRVTQAALFMQDRGYAAVVLGMTNADRGYAISRESYSLADMGTHRVMLVVDIADRGGYVVGALELFLTDRGYYGVQEEAGYAVWVGVDALPDLESDPTAFSTTLPVTIAHPLPLSGTEHLYIITRQRSKHGLYSQNQKPTEIMLDEFGIVRNPIPQPTELKGIPWEGGKFRLIATYPTLETDQYPADRWKLYITNDGNYNIAMPVLNESPIVNIAFAEVGPYIPGTYYFTAILVRNVDSEESPAVTIPIFMPPAPSALNPVLGGYQTEP